MYEWVGRSRRPRHTARLYHTICQASITEKEAYKLSRTQKNVQTVDSLKAEEAEVFLCGDRHATCLAELAAHASEDDLPPNGLIVNVLTVCRQVYVDANPILWGSNTWSFRQSSAWRVWLANMNAVQRRLIRKVHLSQGIIFEKMPKALLSALKGLEELHVDIGAGESYRFEKRE